MRPVCARAGALLVRGWRACAALRFDGKVAECAGKIASDLWDANIVGFIIWLQWQRVRGEVMHGGAAPENQLCPRPCRRRSLAHSALQRHPGTTEVAQRTAARHEEQQRARARCLASRRRATTQAILRSGAHNRIATQRQPPARGSSAMSSSLDPRPCAPPLRSMTEKPRNPHAPPHAGIRIHSTTARSGALSRRP